MSFQGPIIGLVADDRSMQTAIGPQPWQGVNIAYVEAILLAGGVPVILPAIPHNDVSPILAKLDAILLVGGGDVETSAYNGTEHQSVYGVSPQRDSVEIKAAQFALSRQLPMLAICRGMQIVNVSLGGTLLPDIETGIEHMDLENHSAHSHNISVKGESLLASIGFGAVTSVNSLHHQSLALLGQGISVVATAEDGTPEGIEILGNANFLGVQWHPEMLAQQSEHLAVFQWLVDTALRQGSVK